MIQRTNLAGFLPFLAPSALKEGGAAVSRFTKWTKKKLKKGKKAIRSVMPNVSMQYNTPAPIAPIAPAAGSTRPNLVRNIAIFGGGALILGGVVLAISRNRKAA